MNISDAIADLCKEFPFLKKVLPEGWEKDILAYILVIVNGRVCKPDQILKPEDQIIILSPPEGG